MGKLIFMLLLVSCAHTKKEPAEPALTPVEEDLVSMQTALTQAQSSYLLGCVIAHKELDPQKSSFTKCVDRARAHRQQLLEFMNQEVIDEKP